MFTNVIAEYSREKVELADQYPTIDKTTLLNPCDVHPLNEEGLPMILPTLKVEGATTSYSKHLISREEGNILLVLKDSAL